MDDKFELACDQLSADIDGVQFERLRWARDEGPKLARLLELSQGAVKDREDIDLNEEGASGNTKRFVLKVHGNRIAAIAVGLDDKGRATAYAEPIDRSAYTISDTAPIVDDYANVDEEWMGKVLSLLFSRIKPPANAEAGATRPDVQPQDHQSQ